MTKEEMIEVIQGLPDGVEIVFNVGFDYFGLPDIRFPWIDILPWEEISLPFQNMWDDDDHPDQIAIIQLSDS